jgi:hypothetical protein
MKDESEELLLGLEVIPAATPMQGYASQHLNFHIFLERALIEVAPSNLEDLTIVLACFTSNFARLLQWEKFRFEESEAYVSHIQCFSTGTKLWASEESQAHQSETHQKHITVKIGHVTVSQRYLNEGSSENYIILNVNSRIPP